MQVCACACVIVFVSMYVSCSRHKANWTHANFIWSSSSYFCRIWSIVGFTSFTVHLMHHTAILYFEELIALTVVRKRSVWTTEIDTLDENFANVVKTTSAPHKFSFRTFRMFFFYFSFATLGISLSFNGTPRFDSNFCQKQKRKFINSIAVIQWRMDLRKNNYKLFTFLAIKLIYSLDFAHSLT